MRGSADGDLCAARPVTGGHRAGGDDVIRYVDSSGWTWAVCELADRLGANEPADAAVAASDATSQPAARHDGRLHAGPHPADAAPSDAEGAPDDPAGQLYFFSRVGTRKLRGYPSSWSQLPRAGLEALCAAAAEVGGSAQVRGAVA